MGALYRRPILGAGTLGLSNGALLLPSEFHPQANSKSPAGQGIIAVKLSESELVAVFSVKNISYFYVRFQLP